MLQAEVVKGIKTHILCAKVFFYETLAVYERMWKNMAKSYGPEMTSNTMQERCDLHAV